MKKRKSAFTLVELIIATGLLAIVGIAVITMMTSSGNVFSRISNQTQAKMKANQVMEVLVPQARHATGLALLGSQSEISSSKNRYIYASGGRVYISDSGKTTDLFGESFYGNNKIDMVFSPSGNTLKITVTVTSSVDPAVKSTLSTSVQNLNATGISGSGNVLSYQWLTAPAASS